MADKSTFIKLDRNIINWGWFKNSKVLSVFIWLLIKANVKQGHFEKDIIKRGSLVTSNAHIAEGCGLTISNVRTALADMENTGEITRIIRNHYQIITIVNYESYQSAMPKTAVQLTTNLDSNSQATLMATRNNQRIKERKNKRREEESLRSDSSYGDFVRGTDAFRAKSHLLLKPEEGTVDDIPFTYRDQYDNFADYWRYKNQ